MLRKCVRSFFTEKHFGCIWTGCNNVILKKSTVTHQSSKTNFWSCRKAWEILTNQLVLGLCHLQVKLSQFSLTYLRNFLAKIGSMQKYASMRKEERKHKRVVRVVTSQLVRVVDQLKRPSLSKESSFLVQVCATGETTSITDSLGL